MLSQLIVRYQRLSWIQLLNCHNCNQCLKSHKSLTRTVFSKLSKIVSIVSVAKNYQKLSTTKNTKIVKIVKCLKGHKSLGSRCNVKIRRSLSQSVTEWQGHLLSCSGQLKRRGNLSDFMCIKLVGNNWLSLPPMYNTLKLLWSNVFLSQVHHKVFKNVIILFGGSLRQ